MRWLRRSLIGMVGLVLLGGLGDGSLAQDEAQTAPASHEAAVFEGTMLYPYPSQTGTREGVPEERMTRVRGWGWAGRLEDISDPRLAGTFQYVVNDDYYGDAMADVLTAATRIDNAEGSWLGHFIGYHDPRGPSMDSHFSWQGVMTGIGAYAGLTALVILETGEGQGYDVHGIVFPGTLPENPEYPEAAE